MTPPTPFAEFTGLAIVLAVMVCCGCLVALSRLPQSVKLLIYAGLTLRLVGSSLRYIVSLEFYNSYGDSWRYFSTGLEYTERFRQLDFSPFFDPSLWLRGQWWGTSFVPFPSGLIGTVIGPSLRGQYLAFSLLGFLGLLGFAVAFRRAHPDIPLSRYARWIWLFPSLWYWPSILGKEAIVLMGMGLATAGFVGYRERVKWLLLIVGTFLVFSIRPQVAAVLILSFILAYWLSGGSRWTTVKTIQGLLILGAGLGGIWLSMKEIGVGGFDVEGVQIYMQDESARAALGDSAIEDVEIGVGGIPMALINILARPFVWEAHNQMALVAALEILAFWIIVWFRRRNLIHALRTWRSHRLLRVAVPFILVYSILLGMLVVNLGIIARQRVFLFPFLFLLLEAAPASRKNNDRGLRRPRLTRRAGAQSHVVARQVA